MLHNEFFSGTVNFNVYSQIFTQVGKLGHLLLRGLSTEFRVLLLGYKG